MKSISIMNKGVIYKLIPVLLLSVFIISCDPTDFDLPSHQVNLYLPIIELELNLENLILADTTATLTEDSTGLVSINYLLSVNKRFDELFVTYDEREEFTIAGISAELPDIYIDIPLYTSLLDITPGYYSSFPPWEMNYEIKETIEEFIEADFKGGTIKLEITNDFPFVINEGLVVELLNNGEEEPFIDFVLTESINPGNTYSFADADITGKKLTGQFTFKIRNLSSPGGTDITIDQEDKLDVRISYINITLNRASFLIPRVELPSEKLNLTFDYPSGALVEDIRIDSGYISIEIPDLNAFFFVKLTLPSATQNGNPISFELGKKSTIISLENLEIDLSTQSPPFNILPVEFQLMYNESIDTFDINFETPLNGTIEFYNFDYDYLNGYLGKTTDVLNGSIELDLFNRVSSGFFIINNPQFILTFTNGVGTGAVIHDDGNGLYIKGANERLFGDETVIIGSSLDGFAVNGASSRSEPEISIEILDENTEPGLNEYIALLPTELEARIPFTLGTDDINMNQFLDDNSALNLDLELDLPLNMAADRFMLTDTSEFTLSFDDRKYVALSGEFKATFESYFPIKLNIQSIFLDSNKVVLDSLFDGIKIIEPASIDNEGKVTEPFVLEQMVYINEEQMDKLGNTAFLVVNIRIQTLESDYVSLLSSYKLNFKLIGEIITDIDLNQ